MLIIPAIDLKDGRCVRLLQGRAEDSTVYSEDPAGTAGKWAGMGAELLHVVDLDGAFSGAQANLEGIRQIRKAIDIPIEVGGGIRNMEAIDGLVSMGIDRVIIGTAAVKEPRLLKAACDKYPGKVLVGIDANNGKVAIKGWVETTGVDALELAGRMAEAGAAGIIYTDIARDGMLSGPNIGAMKKMALHVNIPVIASGGISNIKDVENLVAAGNIWGAITGKAIYTGSLDLKAAIEIAKGKS